MYRNHDDNGYNNNKSYVNNYDFEDYYDDNIDNNFSDENDNNDMDFVIYLKISEFVQVDYPNRSFDNDK
jgi:hypothetical protein